MRLSLIAAVARNGVIGRDGGLPWRIPADLKHFKATTMGKPIVMGRRTFESIGKALPGRINIVITRNAAFAAEGIVAVGDLGEALALAERSGADEAMVVGGGEIYAAALPRAARLYLTEVHVEAAGNVYFPDLDRTQWREIARQDHAAAGAAPAYSFVTLERVQANADKRG